MVNHGLDEEEMAFKKSMEAQNGDDIDELFNFSGQDELEFDTNDLDNLEMLQVNTCAALHTFVSKCTQKLPILEIVGLGPYEPLTRPFEVHCFTGSVLPTEACNFFFESSLRSERKRKRWGNSRTPLGNDKAIEDLYAIIFY